MEARSGSPKRGQEHFRDQLQRILDSPEFSSSKRLSDFFAFISEAALEGREDLGQYEIAEEFLRRGEDFNPLDDASVRKLASQTRRKLESYYADRGQHDQVVVTLPLRNYVPRYRSRDAHADDAENPPLPPPTVDDEIRLPADVEPEPSVDAAGAAAPTFRALPQEAPARRQSRTAIMLLIVAVAVAATVFGIADYGRVPSSRGEAQDGVFHIITAAGDVMHAGADVQPGAILVGPPMGSGEDLTARLDFLPERATQQAGVMVFRSPDEYIKLGRHFNDRARLEFGYETEARYRKTPATFAFDESGQTGQPLWLKIRSVSGRYLGFVSADGAEWRQFGEELRPPSPFQNGRPAIYALNGRTDAPATDAWFRNVGVGLWFHDREDLAAALDSGDWTLTPSPDDDSRIRIERAALRVQRVPPPGSDPHWRLFAPAPAGDWTIETKLDFSPFGGTYAGLSVTGSDGHLRLIRWDLNGGSVTLEHLVNTQISVPDFPGAPPLTFRLSAKKGVIRGYLSRDGLNFTAISKGVPLSSLGTELTFGLITGNSSWGWSKEAAPIDARFYYVQRMVTDLQPYEIEE